MTISAFTGEYRWLSNFFPQGVRLDGIHYRTVEHAYQAAKTLVDAERAAICAVAAPSLAKRLGRSVTLRPNWADIRIITMRDLVEQKFEHPVLRKRLLDTGDREIIEGNSWGDRFWGVSGGVGENHLGRIIMDLRAELQIVDEMLGRR